MPRNLDDELKKYPELRSHVEKLLDLAENREGEVETIDEAESLVINEVRGLGMQALSNWAVNGEKRTAEELDKQVTYERKKGQ